MGKEGFYYSASQFDFSPKIPIHSFPISILQQHQREVWGSLPPLKLCGSWDLARKGKKVSVPPPVRPPLLLIFCAKVPYPFHAIVVATVVGSIAQSKKWGSNFSKGSSSSFNPTYPHRVKKRNFRIEAEAEIHFNLSICIILGSFQFRRVLTLAEFRDASGDTPPQDILPPI